MGEPLNILYWNTNYKEGSAGKNLYKYNIASQICIDLLKNNIKANAISAIVLTECYPQVNAKMKEFIYNYYCNNKSWKQNCTFEDYKGENDLILNKFIKEFDVFPYEGINVGKDEIPYMKYKELKIKRHIENWSYNPIVIMAQKGKYELINVNNTPGLLIIKEKKRDLFLIGFRVNNDNNLEKYKDLLEIIKKNIKECEKCKIIAIGDCNSNMVETHEIEQTMKRVIKNCKVIDCLDNTTHISKPDKLVIVNCKCNYGDFKVKEKMKEYYEKVKSNIKIIKDNLYKQTFRGTFISAPFPDHNLLFASIEI